MPFFKRAIVKNVFFVSFGFNEKHKFDSVLNLIPVLYIALWEEVRVGICGFCPKRIVVFGSTAWRMILVPVSLFFLLVIGYALYRSTVLNKVKLF